MIHAKFLLSAASASDFPRTGIPEIALVGRSNVGKSSLINALVKQTIARTSAAPGKTRLANYYLIESQIPSPRLRAAGSSALRRGSPELVGGFDRQAKAAKSRQSSFYLVDIPGYGYARGGQASAETFEALTNQYFDPATRSGRHLAGAVHVIDARHPDLPQDAAAFQWLMRAQLPIAIVATKMDKLKRSEQSKTVKALETKYGVSVLPESAMNGTGLDDIWKVLCKWSGPEA